MATDLQEGVEQVLEGACFGGDETFEERVEGLGLCQHVLYACRFFLKPDTRR